MDRKEYQKEWTRRKRLSTKPAKVSTEMVKMSTKEGVSTGLVVDKEKAIKLLKVCSALDRTVAGLYGRENMLDMVRYGDLTMREVRERLIKP